MKNALAVLALTALVAAVPAFAQNSDSIHSRRANQQERIAQGVRSGSLTARETVQLEHREARINRQIRADRADHGGRLTAPEKRQINREQNRASRQIYRDKHNGFTR